MSKGVIYILTNPSFPEYIKIGYATDIEKRLQQLNRSETVPFAFRVYAVYEVDNELTDKELHKLIDSLNPNLRSIETFDGKERIKEFFAMSAESGYALLNSIAKISGTSDRLKRMEPEGHDEAVDCVVQESKIAKTKKPGSSGKRKTSRPQAPDGKHRSRLRFSMIGLKPGDTLVFTEDTSITVTVADDEHILYNGEITSMSALAQKLIHNKWPVQGTTYFMYHGKRLTDLRYEAEKQ